MADNGGTPLWCCVVTCDGVPAKAPPAGARPERNAILAAGVQLALSSGALHNTASPSNSNITAMACRKPCAVLLQVANLAELQ